MWNANDEAMALIFGQYGYDDASLADILAQDCGRDGSLSFFVAGSGNFPVSEALSGPGAFADASGGGFMPVRPPAEMRCGLWVWRSDEPIEHLKRLARLTDAEEERYDSITSLSRRREYLTVRASISTVLGKRISYHPSKKPFITDDDRFISISHTGQWVVAALDTKPTGVDTEYLSRDVSRVSHRIFSPREMSLTENPTVLWCAKEAAYKAYGMEGTDFLRDITVTDIAGNRIFVDILSRHITLMHFTLGELMIVVCE